jgi:hypothetical protein
MEEKTYQTPEIIYEGELEVQAGSAIQGSESQTINPLGMGLGTDDG